jgi:hypothetical protein
VLHLGATPKFSLGAIAHLSLWEQRPVSAFGRQDRLARATVAAQELTRRVHLNGFFFAFACGRDFHFPGVIVCALEMDFSFAAANGLCALEAKALGIAERFAQRQV